jgi:hypothetical protein
MLPSFTTLALSASVCVKILFRVKAAGETINRIVCLPNLLLSPIFIAQKRYKNKKEQVKEIILDNFFSLHLTLKLSLPICRYGLLVWKNDFTQILLLLLLSLLLLRYEKEFSFILAECEFSIFYDVTAEKKHENLLQQG